MKVPHGLEMGPFSCYPEWDTQTFVRGTLRLQGWSGAWADVFAEVETLTGPEGDARLQEMSDQFWAAHAYDPDEPDRVVMCVDLRAERFSDINGSVNNVAIAAGSVIENAIGDVQRDSDVGAAGIDIGDADSLK